MSKYTIEITCDRWVDGKGFETQNSVLDTDKVDSLEGIDLPWICSNAGYKFDLEDGEDYRIAVRVYDEDHNEVEHDIAPVWASDL